MSGLTPLIKKAACSNQWLARHRANVRPSMLLCSVLAKDVFRRLSIPLQSTLIAILKMYVTMLHTLSQLQSCGILVIEYRAQWPTFHTSTVGKS